jgi:PAS domain S-box-containing protein
VGFMDYINNDRQKNVNNILTMVKLGGLFFGLLIVLIEVLVRKKTITSMSPLQYIEGLYVIFIPLMIIVYLAWSHFYANQRYDKYSKRVIKIENFIFMLFFSLLIILSDSYASEFKFLFLFLIISSSIQLGARFGMGTALMSSIIILTIDIIYSPKTSVNLHFENDLILSGAFILVAWCLGKYVELEKENINRKDKQLELLNMKLSEQELKRKYIENMIMKNEACYNLLINNSNDAIFIHRNNELVFSNESAARLIGLQPEVLTEKSMLDFVPGEEREDTEHKYSNIYKDEANTTSFEHKIIGMEGTTVAVKNTSTYFIYEGKPTILTILHDITSEKQVEKLQKDVEKNIELLNETREFNRFITEFFSNISHELKTPLNIIFSAIQLLGVYNEKNIESFIKNKDKYLGIMKQNCYRLMRLINNLLEITRVDSGFLKPQFKNCNIVSVVENITLSVCSFAESKGIGLIFDTDCEEKIMAIDPDKLERIILNLLSNAVKFTQGGGDITVNMIDEGDSIAISVKDTGIGIPEDKLEFIFERFRQVDRTFTRNHEGSGIGLSLVKSFVEMHKGFIGVSSELGEGSEFIIRLPAKILKEDYIDENHGDDSIIERISIEFSDIYS